MSKSKDQGTRFQTLLKKRFKEAGFQVTVLGEEGLNDIGDLLVIDEFGDHWVIEARHRENMSPHRALLAAVRKAEKFTDAVVSTALIWKRSLKKPGQKVRTADGTGVVVIIELETYISLLKAYEE
jgi:hypothetical protein